MVATALLAGVLPACTDAGLEQMEAALPFRDDKFRAAGSLCTASPESKLLPLRVLFVVDASESMRVTDPGDPVTEETGRERAVQEAWESVLEGGPEGVRVGIVRFSAEARSETQHWDSDPPEGPPDSYFTTDRVKLEAGTTALRYTDRTTHYLNALSEAYFELRTEMMAAELVSLPLSKYVVIFVSDGLPDTDSSAALTNSEENILEAVDQLRELGELFHVGELQFHTAYISAGEGPARDRGAQELLKKMAEVGNGTFRSFPSGESLNFLHVDFTVVRRVFTLKTLSAININSVLDRDQITQYLRRAEEEVEGEGEADGGVDAERADAGVEDGEPDEDFLRLFVDVDGNGLPACGEFLVDTDSDGLADLTERELGTNPLLRDSDDDGLNDRLEWKLISSGMDPVEPDDDCLLAEQCLDEDSDGFCDCLLDADANGVCDCEVDPDVPCHDDAGHDCLDEDEDGWCDCPDLNRDERCDYDDKDLDGLNDCEEVFYGTAQNGDDSDADGLPDWMEVHVQSDPVEADRSDDVDWDHTPNGTEVLSGTDPWCDESRFRSLVSIQNRVDTVGLFEGVTCYDFEVKNITVLPTAGNPADLYPGNGWNRILLYAGEVSFDAPDSYPFYRIACVMVRYDPDGNYKNPPSGRIRLTEEDFIDASEFDEEEHCIWP